MSDTRKPILANVPRDFTRAPFFASTRQAEPRELVIDDRTYVIGGYNPIDPDRFVPALDIRHGRAIFTLLSFRRFGTTNHLVRFSMNEFCKRYAKTQGGKYSRYLRRIFADLMECYIHITTGDRITHHFRLIERFHASSREIRRKDAKRAVTPQKEFWLEEIELSPEFNDMVNTLTELAQIRVDVLNGLTSPLAQTIYTYLPSRSHHHSEADPFQITLTNLLTQVCHPVPKYKSLRKKLFVQNKSSILSQLDGAETLSGTLHARIVPTVDDEDYKLLTWVTPRVNANAVIDEANSKMLQAWRLSGRSVADYRNRTKSIPALDAYELELLTVGEIDIEKNEGFFRKSKALLGKDRFESLLSEAKAEVLEGRQATKSPTARLVFRIMEVIEKG